MTFLCLFLISTYFGFLFEYILASYLNMGPALTPDGQIFKYAILFLEKSLLRFSATIVCLTRVWQSLFPLFCDKTFKFAIQTWQTSLEHYYVYVQTYFLSQVRKMLILLISSYCKMCTLPTLRSLMFVCCEQYKHARSYCWQWTHLTMGPNEQNQHFAELRQKICLHIYVVVLLTCLPSLDGKLERFVTKKWQN